MKILIGNIFDSQAQTIVNTVNCVGVMGKGIAAEFKDRYPGMFKDYAARCERGEVRPGVPYIYRESMFSPQIINFPTKSDWRAASRIQDIEKGLRILTDQYKEWGIESIAMPPLGCGNGQLLWESVGPLIYKYLSQWNVPVEMYAPYGTPKEQLQIEFLTRSFSTRQAGTGNNILQKLNPAWVALAEIVYRIEKQTYHMPVGRVIFQKIAYVATALGLPTGLKHIRSSFGPYCAELKEVQKRLSNASLIQEQKSGNMLRVLPGLAYEKDRKKYSEDIQKWDGLIDKTVDLFLRLNTKQAEIVATVMFVEKEINDKNGVSERDVLMEVLKWKQKRNPPLSEKEVAIAIRNLGILKWFQLQPSSDLPLDDI